jgi:hypothetical protein
MANFTRRIESVTVNKRLSRNFQNKTERRNDEKPNKIDFSQFSVDDRRFNGGLPGTEKHRRYRIEPVKILKQGSSGGGSRQR